MVIKSYFLEYSPSPRDQNRYKLNLSGIERDIKELVSRLSNISSRPFPSADRNFQWSCYLYDLTDEKRDSLKSQLENEIDVSSEVKKEEKNTVPEPEETRKEPEVKKEKQIRLNSDYVFESFVVGTATRFTYAACKSVAESPGKNYNPLFIYGGVGLGKTHLMHSIGNHVRNKFPDDIIVYIKTDEFVMEVVDAIECGALNEMRQKYRQIDLLLVDDIQFLEKSESTQEEFFHIFNEMYEVSKQIVITSDKPPKKLLTLEDRLKSRFEWGLTTDIKIPNFETRKAIIKKKSTKLGITIDEAISDYIARKLNSNIRELEGIINRIYAYRQLSEDEITLDFVKDIIRNMLPDSEEDEKQLAVEEKAAAGDLKQAQTPAGQPSVLPPLPYAPGPPPPVHAPGYIPAQVVPDMCPRCGRQMTFVQQYRKWYCTVCAAYMEPMQSYPPPYVQLPGPCAPPPPPPGGHKSCHKCSSPLMFIQEYGRYYCNTCREYEPESPQVPAEKESENKKVMTHQPSLEDLELITGKRSIEGKTDSDKAGKEKKTQKKEKEEPVSFEDKIIGEEKDNIREIKTGYFVPEGKGSQFSTITDKLSKLTTQKKFNFFIRPLFTHYFSTDMEINYDKIAHMASTNDIDIAICMQPEEGAGKKLDEFRESVTAAMDKLNMPFEILSQDDMKESNALNFMLDIAICARKRPGK
ncbi:MAG: chromosomal replication initiator protein DnaA [Elusimicrobiota bacterium]